MYKDFTEMPVWGMEMGYFTCQPELVEGSCVLGSRFDRLSVTVPDGLSLTRSLSHTLSLNTLFLFYF